VLSVTLTQPNEFDVDTIVNLTGLTVKFRMLNQSGVEVIALTTTGVTVTDATAGEVQYDFGSTSVSAVGRYYGYFVVVDVEKTDHFPVASRHLVICIEGHA
jgi:hypothetical protein